MAYRKHAETPHVKYDWSGGILDRQFLVQLDMSNALSSVEAGWYKRR